MKKIPILFGVLLLMIILPITVFFSHQQQKTEQQAAGQSSYPANIDFEGMNSYGTYNQAALSNPNVGAVDISYNWSQIEPQQGVFNWGPGDKEMADWAAQGKKFTIVARYINEGSGNCNGFQLMPAWEIARIPHFCSTTGQMTYSSRLRSAVSTLVIPVAD